MVLNEPTQLQLGEAVGLEDNGDGEALEAESIISSSGHLFNIIHNSLKITSPCLSVQLFLFCNCVFFLLNLFFLLFLFLGLLS
jgi:hypothetical protein